MEKGDIFYTFNEKLRDISEKKLYDTVFAESFDSLLDIGCGDGHFIKWFQDKKTFGIDINQSMLDQAKGLEGKLAKINIITDESFIETHRGMYDIITSNYVFNEFKQVELQKTFEHAYQLMHEGSKLYFTITDPRTRDRMEFPGYLLVFDEPYEYHKCDLKFEVKLQDTSGKYQHVGIFDYHQPIEVYDSLLTAAGFESIQRTDITEGCDCSHAVIYHAKK